jgi:hypothetical protein
MRKVIPSEPKPFFGMYCRLRRPSDIRLFEQIAGQLENPSNVEILRVLMQAYAKDRKHGITL